MCVCMWSWGEWSMCKFEKQNCLEDSCHSLTLSLLIGLDMTCPGILPPPHNWRECYKVSHDNPLIPPREILEIPNSQLPVLLVPAVQANNLKTCHTLIQGGAISTHFTLSSGEEPCHLASHSHTGRSCVDSRHTLIRREAVSTHITLSSREEPCWLASHSHPGRTQLELHSYVLISLAGMYMCMWWVLIVTQISSSCQDCQIWVDARTA